MHTHEKTNDPALAHYEFLHLLGIEREERFRRSLPPSLRRPFLFLERAIRAYEFGIECDAEMGGTEFIPRDFYKKELDIIEGTFGSRFGSLDRFLHRLFSFGGIEALMEIQEVMSLDNCPEWASNAIHEQHHREQEAIFRKGDLPPY